MIAGETLKSSMQILMAASILLSTIIGTIVGVKLVLLATRTREHPELTIGVGLVCYATVAQTSLLISSSLGADATHAQHMTLLALRLLAYYFTLIGLSLFTWQVFGAKSQWRRALTAFIAVSAIFTIGTLYWASWHLLGTDGQLPLYARFGASPQYVILFAWMACESLLYYRLMQKRQVLGLADPVVTNRFGVWGIAAAASSILLVALLTVQLTRNIMLGADPLSSALITATGVVNTIGWWLTFMPPRVYTRWLRGPVATEGSHG
jgi:hypothetical protein